VAFPPHQMKWLYFHDPMFRKETLRDMSCPLDPKQKSGKTEEPRIMLRCPPFILHIFPAYRSEMEATSVRRWSAEVKTRLYKSLGCSVVHLFRDALSTAKFM